MSEEIIIKTESVKVSELEGREKQIYDYAYQKGYDSAVDINLERKSGNSVIIVLICFMALLAVLSVTCSHLPPL